MSAPALTALDEKRYAKLLAKVLPRAPQNDEEHDRLAEILLELDERSDTEKLTPEEEALAELLTVVLDEYGRKHTHFEGVTGNERLKAVLEFRGLKQKDIVPIIGNKGLTSQILNGQRAISKEIAKKLAAHFDLPADMFL